MIESTDYIVTDSKNIFNHSKAQIYVDRVSYRGKEKVYLYLTSPVESVATVGITRRGEIILTHQYRHPIQRVIYDLPGGVLEPGEDPMDGARREFEEETGFHASHIEKIGYYNQFPGTVRAATSLFFATDLEPTHQNLDEGEELDIVFKPVSEVVEMVLRGEILDGSLQLGVLLALQKGLLDA